MNASAARQVWKTPTTTNTAGEKTICKFRLFYQTLVFILSGFYGELQPPQQIFPRQWHLQYFTSCTCEISGSLTGEDLLLNKVREWVITCPPGGFICSNTSWMLNSVYVSEYMIYRLCCLSPGRTEPKHNERDCVSQTLSGAQRQVVTGLFVKWLKN